MSFENVKMVKQPVDLKINLYPHQLSSIYQMEKMETDQQIVKNEIVIESKISIFADITGYGKTLSIIGLIMRDKMKWLQTGEEKDFVFCDIETLSGGLVIKRKYNSSRKINTNLVLVGHSIIKQWEKELSQSSLKYISIISKKLIETTNIKKYDVILITNTMYNKFTKRHPNVVWKRFIFDEPGHLRVSAMNKINCGFMWLVTATPYSILTHHKKVRQSFMYNIVGQYDFSLFENIFMRHLCVKNDKEFIEHSFKMPVPNHIYHKCYQPILKTIGNMVNDKISQMISAGDILGAIKALGGDKPQNIIELIKSRKAKELEEIQEKIRVYKLGVAEDEDSERAKKKEREWIDRENVIYKQLDGLEDRYKTILESDCNICYEKLKKPVMEPYCQNIFCAECMLKWLKLKKTCPLCRNNTDPKELIFAKTSREYEEEAKHEDESKEEIIPTKENTVVEIISKNPKNKYIIFSMWNGTFNKIRNILTNNDIEYIEIKGSVDKRKRHLDKFRNGNIPVIFLNADNNGYGLNLQDVSDIIIYHEMNVDTTNQILGRVNRIGRTTPVNVHHLIV